MSSRSPFRRSLGAIVLCGLFGFGALALGVGAGIEHLLFMATAERTVGTVTRFERYESTVTKKGPGGRKETKLEVRVYPWASFTYQGKTYEVRRDSATWSFNPGDPAPIAFQPGNPHEARFDEPGEVWGTVVSGLVFGLFFLGVGGHELYTSRRPARPSPPPVPAHPASAPIPRVRAHVPGHRLTLEMPMPGQHGWIAWPAGLGIPSAGIAFLVGAPLVGLGILAAAGAVIACALRWMKHRVDFTLGGVEVRRGFRRQRFERVGLRGVKLDLAEPGDAFRLWLERRDAEPPVTVLHASFTGPRAAFQAQLEELQKALEGLDLRVTMPQTPAEAPRVTTVSTRHPVPVTRFFRRS